MFFFGKLFLNSFTDFSDYIICSHISSEPHTSPVIPLLGMADSIYSYRNRLEGIKRLVQGKSPMYLRFNAYKNIFSKQNPKSTKTVKITTTQ